jgi:hypothetical protein
VEIVKDNFDIFVFLELLPDTIEQCEISKDEGFSSHILCTLRVSATLLLFQFEQKTKFGTDKY